MRPQLQLQVRINQLNSDAVEDKQAADGLLAELNVSSNIHQHRRIFLLFCTSNKLSSSKWKFPLLLIFWQGTANWPAFLQPGKFSFFSSFTDLIFLNVLTRVFSTIVFERRKEHWFPPDWCQGLQRPMRSFPIGRLSASVRWLTSVNRQFHGSFPPGRLSARCWLTSVNRQFDGSFSPRKAVSYRSLTTSVNTQLHGSFSPRKAASTRSLQLL